MHLLPGCGHLPFWERPVELFARVSAFLDEPDAGS